MYAFSGSSEKKAKKNTGLLSLEIIQIQNKILYHLYQKHFELSEGTADLQFLFSDELQSNTPELSKQRKLEAIKLQRQ